MTEQKTNVITIDGKEYNQEDLSRPELFHQSDKRLTG